MSVFVFDSMAFLRVGGGICSLTGFFLKLNWIFFETQLFFLKPNWAAFSASSGLRVAPFVSPSLSASGLRVSPFVSPSLSASGLRVAPSFTFALCVGARVAPPVSPLLSASGLRVAPSFHLRSPRRGSALAPLLRPLFVESRRKDRANFLSLQIFFRVKGQKRVS